MRIIRAPTKFYKVLHVRSAQTVKFSKANASDKNRTGVFGHGSLTIVSKTVRAVARTPASSLTRSIENLNRTCACCETGLNKLCTHLSS